MLYGLGVVNTRAQLLKLEKVMKQAAIDKYVFQRNAYLQHRAYLIQRNKELSNPYIYDHIPHEEESQAQIDDDTSYLDDH
jgi:phospholipid-binding lipoprotein MlaA